MCFYYDDAEYCPIFNQTIVVGKKDYKCESCRRAIAKGEQQLYVFYVMNGDAEHYRVCNQCVQDEAAIARHEKRNGCDGSEAHPYWQDVHSLISRGNPDEDWHPEFEGDEDGGNVLFWPYDVPPARLPINLKTLPDYATS